MSGDQARDSRGESEVSARGRALQANDAQDAMPLARLAERATSTRRTSLRHVTSLADSIAAVGLIQPIAVDKDGTLLAGGHRLAALQLLRQNNREAFDRLFPRGLVPVRVMDTGSSKEGARRALEIELSENEKRRDYTGKEIALLVERLKAAGYKTTGAGARRKGDKQKHMTEALAVILGKSRRQVQRLIATRAAPARRSKQEVVWSRCLQAMRGVLELALRNDGLENEFQKLIEAVKHAAADVQQRQVSVDAKRERKNGAA